MGFLDITFFQSGSFQNYNHQEDWLSVFLKFAPIIISGIISTLLALYIFNRGKKKEDDKDKEKLKDVRELLFLYIMDFQRAVRLQIKSLDGVIITMNKDLEDEKNQTIKLRFFTYFIGSMPNYILEIPRMKYLNFSFWIKKMIKLKE